MVKGGKSFVPGLSPRGRGSLGEALCAALDTGSIPAWAGEPLRRLATPGGTRVYPRVGGGALCEQYMTEATEGLSPRGRGSHLDEEATDRTGGSIPAWAGEPSGPRRRAR